MLNGTVLITGGAGFLGRGILRRALREQWPAKFIVYSRDEQKHIAAQRKYSSPNIKYVLGDILDTPRLHLLMTTCDYVIHTAAIKYIPECEAQPSEAIRVNIDGTRSVMDAARAAGVPRTVIISTDKACHPVNTYGMTKALTERMVFETADMPHVNGATFSAARYGNVIGSTGSIWPVFKQQASQYRTISVTNPEMTRFYITIDEAVQVILQAFSAPNGTVVVPEPRALQLGELVAHLETLDGWAPLKVNIIGPRDGEKVHECIADPFDEWPRMKKYATHWELYGPTVTTNENDLPEAMFSDVAAKLNPIMPAEFVRAAIDSEEV